MATITKYWNMATVEFACPDSRTTFHTLISDFLTGTGQYANTNYDKLLVTVKGGNPTGASQPDYGTGTEADPYTYFRFSTPSTTTRKATVVIDWSGINLTIGYSDNNVYRYMDHNLALNSTIHHMNLNITNNCKKGYTCYIGGQGNVTFENSEIKGGVTTEESTYAAVLHNGGGTVNFLNTTVEGTNKSRTVLNNGNGKIFASHSNFKHNDKYYWGIFNDVGTVFMDNCNSFGLVNLDVAYADNCWFNNEVYSEGEMHLSNSKVYGPTGVAGGKSFIDNCELYNRVNSQIRLNALQVEKESILMMSNTYCVAFNTERTSSSADAVGLFVVPNQDSLIVCRVNAVNCVFGGFRNSANTSTKGYGLASYHSNGKSNCYINLSSCRFISNDPNIVGTHDVDLELGDKVGSNVFKPSGYSIVGCTFSDPSVSIGGSQVTSMTSSGSEYMPAYANRFSEPD